MTRWAVDFTPPDATVLKLRDPDNGLYLLGDIDGLDAPTVELSEQELFDQQGSQLNQVRFGPREVTVPIAILAPDAQTLRLRCRELVSVVNPRLGDGLLTIRADDGIDEGRVLTCRYVKGLEGLMETFDMGDGWWAAAPVFRGFDPYWKDPHDTVATFTVAPGGGPTAINFFPMFDDASNVGPHFGTITGSGVTSQLSVLNDGDDITFPRWVVTGPIDNLVLTNLSTGQAMDFSANGGLNLADTDTMTIDPTAFPAVYDQHGANLIPFLQPASVPWALGVGDNEVQVSGTLIGDGASVRLSYRRRFLSA